MSVAVPEEHLHLQPILTRAYDEPKRHWKTVAGETSNEIVTRRRSAEEPLPMGPAMAIQQGLAFDDQAAMAGAIDKLRGEVREWRAAGWPGTSNATRELLEYWAREPGEGPVFSPFYAQREAIETVIFLTERGNGTHEMVRRLKALGEGWNRGLTRLALRMATGTGKTMVMACLIAWYPVNRRREHRGDSRGWVRSSWAVSSRPWPSLGRFGRGIWSDSWAGSRFSRPRYPCASRGGSECGGGSFRGPPTG